MITEQKINEAALQHVEGMETSFQKSDIDIAIIGFKNGAKWLQDQDRWIPVTDTKRLPKGSGPVLGCMKDTLDMYICFYRKPRKLFEVYGAGADPISDMKVTHWQPLPGAPSSALQESQSEPV